MPNTKQAKKRMVTDERKRLENKAMRTRMKTAIKAVHQAETAEAAQKALPEAVKRVDKCAKKNIIHDNAAARTKARLAKFVASK